MSVSGEIVLVLHNIRSAYNVGALFRSADGAGISKLYLTGYTPHPNTRVHTHATKAHKMIAKTALGAESSVSWEHAHSLKPILEKLRLADYTLVALEQAPNSQDYRTFRRPEKMALIVGNEVRGVDARILKQCDAVIEIPMYGSKNSLNVSVAGSIALFSLRGTIEG